MALRLISSRDEITQELIHLLLAYDPDTGIFSWKEKPRELCSSERQFNRWNSTKPGKQAGSVNGLGYRHISISGIYMLAHRLAWFHTHGVFPKEEIDHINGDKTDNRIANLRCVSGSQNCKNRPIPKHNTSGTIGIAPARSKGRWIVHIMVGSENVYLGTFKDIEMAKVARKAAEKVAGYHPNHGRRTA